MQKNFIFATGIECSYPTMKNGVRRDILEETNHYFQWKKDFELTRELGIKFMRYGIPYYKMHTGPETYDWSFSDEVIPVMLKMGIVPIIDLCHFGVPDWVGGFQNEKWPTLFAKFAGAFAQRYPEIHYYTPVNEMLISARFSGLLGIWNECLTTTEAMVKGITTTTMASVLAMQAILEQTPNAVFIHAEPCEYFHQRDPQAIEETNFRNEFRFLTFDLVFGHEPGSLMLDFLQKNKMGVADYEKIINLGKKLNQYQIMGLDYYPVNERVIYADGREEPVGPILGWYTLARQYYERYYKPLMLTETNNLTMNPSDAPKWLWELWFATVRLRQDSIPVIGMTWYSLHDQLDWGSLLGEKKNEVIEVGLYTIDREPRPISNEYKKLIADNKDLPLLAQFALAGIED